MTLLYTYDYDSTALAALEESAARTTRAFESESRTVWMVDGSFPVQGESLWIHGFFLALAHNTTSEGREEQYHFRRPLISLANEFKQSSKRSSLVSEESEINATGTYALSRFARISSPQSAYPFIR